MSDIAGAIRQLLALGEAHWFCPRKSQTDYDVFFPEDIENEKDGITPEDRRQAIKDFEARKPLIFQALQIFAYDGGDSEKLLAQVKEQVGHYMRSCDICVRQYYRLRSELRQELEAQHDVELVAAFMKRFDDFNTTRINNNLNHATNLLLRLSENDRKLSKLDDAAVYAFFEAVSSPQFCRSEVLVKEHFDKPFALVKGVKRLTVRTYLPGSTSFLFSWDASRRQWAERIWSKISRQPSAEEFQWTSRPFLLLAGSRVQMGSLEINFLPIFWRAVKTITLKLDKELITHSLRELDFDVIRLTLDHMHLDFEGFEDMIAFISRILEVAPHAFWDSMNAINPQTVIEQVFKSPNLRPILTTGNETGLGDILIWQKPFLESLSPATMPIACRSLVQHFMEIHNSTSYPVVTRSYAFEHALYAISITLTTLIAAGQVDPACLTEMLQLVNEHSSEILMRTRGLKLTAASETSLALKVVQNSFELECSLLNTTYNLFIHKKTLSAQHLSVLGLGLSNKIPKILKVNDVALATYSLIGSKKLSLIEKITAKYQALPPDAIEFNTAFDNFCSNIAVIVDRVNTFENRDIDSLLKASSTASGLLACLFVANDDLRLNAIEVLETSNADGEAGTDAALRFILSQHYLPTVKSLAEGISRVKSAKLYRPLKAVIKIVIDVIQSLCNSQDGLLRSKDLTEDECLATTWLWKSIWASLMTIFSNTESWSTIHHQSELGEFCRDVMQFANDLFEYYPVLVSSISEEHANQERKDTITKQLLKGPNDTMSQMVKWLRLRDEHLADTSTKLVSNLLIKLHSAKLEISDETKVFLENIIDSKIKHKLTKNQIAALSRSLDTLLGITSDQHRMSLQTKAIPKQSSITTFLKDGVAIKSEGTSQASHQSTTITSTVKSGLTKSLPAAQKNKITLDSSRDAFLKQRQADKLAKDKEREERENKRRGLGDAGSGLKGLSVFGKDHNIKSDLMASSSSEGDDDDSDEDDFDKELFGSPVNKKKSRITMLPKSEIRLIETPKTAVVVKRVARSTKDNRARLAPDLVNLHKTILSWDYFHTGEFPPGKDASQYQKLPSTFTNAVQYLDMFLPLLLLEAWQSFVKSREEMSSKALEMKVANRSTVDMFHEVSTMMSIKDASEIGAGDIVLLSRVKSPQPTDESCLARVHKCSKSKKGLEVVFRIASGSKMTNNFTGDALIYGMKIQSLTPLEREYGALQGLQYYDLCDYILKAQPSNLLTYKDIVIDPIAKNYSLNKAQAKAVKSAIDNDAFTLIQGPPGSGKTKTITAIVGALLSNSLKNEPTGTTVRVPGGAGATQNQAVKKLLVCAPSNAAVDELVMRLKQGVRTMSGQDYKIKVVRLGRSDAINAAVQDVTLEELTNQRLGVSTQSNGNKEDTQRLMMEHQAVSEKLRVARQVLDAENTLKNKEAMDQLRREKTALNTKIDESKDKEKQNSRQAELARRHVQQAILDEAHIICATLSGSGHEMFQNLNIEFETVVVDEAAQCVEASALIPLKYGCAKCILVGDPKQLPPTVLSKEATRFQYEQSLFVRMQSKYPNDAHLLDTQYRMHPDISSFPSATFYDGKLVDGPNMASLRIRPWHCNPLLGPYRFFDVKGQHQTAVKGHSLINLAEIKVAVSIYRRVITDFHNFGFKSKIGIITPYKSQLVELKKAFSREFGSDIIDKVDFNTTDAFQGRESEIIIFSCVRASSSGSIGFLQDIRRMNVGLTRAKSSLWVLGNSESLMRGEFWAKLIRDAESRAAFRTGNYMDELKKPTSSKLIEKWKSQPYQPQTPHDGPVVKQEAKSKSSLLANAEQVDAMNIDDFHREIQQSDGKVKQEPSSTSPSRKNSITTNATDNDRIKEVKKPTTRIKVDPVLVSSSRNTSVSLDATDAMDIDPKSTSDIEKKDKSQSYTHQPPTDPISGNSLVLPVSVPPIRKRKNANPLIQPRRDKKPKP